MTIWQRDTYPATTSFVEGWAFPDKLIYLRTGAHPVLKEEMQRYLRREVTGRSFLISGHRGAGKTATVLRAVDDTYREAIEQSVSTVLHPRTLFSPRAFQRPLLVKLHGPSLKDDTLSGDTSPPVKETAHAMLVQITLGLYRAFAEELSACFVRQAQRLSPDGAFDVLSRGEALELAAQLTMDLDRGAEAAVLRSYWQRMGRLATGVLWPDSVGTAMANAGYADRGMQEIVAAITAGQAFRVCSGQVTYEHTRIDSAERDNRVEAATRLDGKDLLNKVWGLVAAGVVGAALWPVSVGAAAVAGVGAGLIGTTALNWSSRRTRRSQLSADYRFVPNSSPATLDRDLPVVIGRIRETGLAPVFLVDELDKVENGGSVIPEIINRLKNLTTDYGFFCFLTDRDYFESVERTVRSGAFPREATYFSQRWIVVQHPTAIGEYVHERLALSEAPSTADDIARYMLSCIIPYRAKGNMADVIRELSSQSGIPPSEQIVFRRHYRWQMVIQLAIEHILRREELRGRIEKEFGFLQIALDALYMIARAWERGDRSIELSRSAVRDRLMDRLRIASAGAGLHPTEKNKIFSDTVNDADLGLLHEQVVALALLLSRFGAIRDLVAIEPDFAVVDAFGGTFDHVRFGRLRIQFQDIEAQGLLARDEVDADLWHFLLYPDGRVVSAVSLVNAVGQASLPLAARDTRGNLTVDTGAVQRRPIHPAGATQTPTGQAATPGENSAAPHGVPAETLHQIDQALGRLRSFISAVDPVLRLDDLIDAGLLPLGFQPNQLAAIGGKLSRAQQDDESYPDLAGDLLQIAGLVQNLEQRWREIATVLALTSLIVEDVGRLPGQAEASVGHAQALRAIDHLIGVRQFGDLLRGITADAISAGTISLRDSLVGHILRRAAIVEDPPQSAENRWTSRVDQLKASLRAVAGLGEDPVEACWSTWDWRRVSFVSSNRETPPLMYPELVLHAANRLPTGAFNNILIAQTTVAEWSAFCMRVFNGEAAPQRALADGLRMLGFGPTAFHRALEWGNLTRQTAHDEPGLIPPDRPGRIILYDEPIPDTVLAAPIPDRPVLAIPWNQIESYNGIRSWLTGNGLITQIEGYDEADE